MLILGIEPSLIAYKTIVRTDTLYEQKKTPDLGLEPRTSRLEVLRSIQLSQPGIYNKTHHKNKFITIIYKIYLLT